MRPPRIWTPATYAKVAMKMATDTRTNAPTFSSLDIAHLVFPRVVAGVPPGPLISGRGDGPETDAPMDRNSAALNPWGRSQLTSYRGEKQAGPRSSMHSEAHE